MKTKADVEKKGVAQAALLAAMLGILSLSLVNLATEVSERVKSLVHAAGKTWMPGAGGIGPYSGKETLALVVWLGSWFFLHRILRAREWNHLVVLTSFLLGIALATTLLWPPVIHWTAHFVTQS